MTINELILKLSTAPFHVFGKLEYEIDNLKNTIIIIDNNNTEDYSDKAEVFYIYYNDDNIINAIDGSYGFITEANRDEVIAVAKLIGKKIKF